MGGKKRKKEKRENIELGKSRIRKKKKNTLFGFSSLSARAEKTFTSRSFRDLLLPLSSPSPPTPRKRHAVSALFLKFMGRWHLPQGSPRDKNQEETMSAAKNGNAGAGAPPPPPPPPQQQQLPQQQPGPPVPGAPTVTLIRTATATAINAEKEGQQQQGQQQQQRGARPFDASASPDVENAASRQQPPASTSTPSPLSTAAAEALTPPAFKPYVRQTRINWTGSAAFLFYLGALAFYLWVRITKTLDLGKYTAVS